MEPHPQSGGLSPVAWLAAAFAAVVSISVLGLSVFGSSGEQASASGGDFHFEFIAADHETYDHVTGIESSAAGLQYDDRDIGTHVREELEATDFVCEDRVVFFTAVEVDDSAKDDTVIVTYHFDARNNGQEGVGYREVIAAGVSFEDFAGSQTEDAGNVGLSGDESATLLSQQYVTKPQGDPSGTVPAGFGSDDAEVLEAKVEVAGLDPGEQLVVRVDVRFACFAGNATGNLHAALDSVEDPEGGNIPAGRQEIPMKGLGGVAVTSTSGVTPTATLSPGGTPAVPPPTASATPTPTATPPATALPTASPCPPGIILNFAGLAHGAILTDQFEDLGIHISVEANNNFPDAIIVFDTDRPPTHDPDLAVDIGNIAILAKNLTDNNNDDLVDDPDENDFGGTVTFTFDQPVTIGSFIFVDHDHQASDFAAGYDASDNLIKKVFIPIAGNGSVQTIDVDADGVSRFELVFRDSGGFTGIEVGCPPTGSPTPPAITATPTPTGTPGPSPTPTGTPSPVATETSTPAGATQTPSPVATETSTAPVQTPTPTATATPSPPVETATPSPIATETATPPGQTESPTATPEETETPAATTTPTPTATPAPPGPTETATPTQTPAPTATATPSATATPTATPSQPAAATETPSETESPSATATATASATSSPTVTPVAPTVGSASQTPSPPAPTQTPSPATSSPTAVLGLVSPPAAGGLPPTGDRPSGPGWPAIIFLAAGLALGSAGLLAAALAPTRRR